MYDKDWRRHSWRGGEHPPACTCRDCAERRLQRLRDARLQAPIPPQPRSSSAATSRPVPTEQPAEIAERQPSRPPSEVAERQRYRSHQVAVQQRERSVARRRAAFRVAGASAAVTAILAVLVVVGVVTRRLEDPLTQWPLAADWARQAHGVFMDEVIGFVVFAILIGGGLVSAVWTITYLLAQAVHYLLRR